MNELPTEPATGIKTELIVNDDQRGSRLDVFVHAEIGGFSRVQIGRWINQHRVLVNGQSSKPAYRVRGGDEIGIDFPPPEPMGSKPENIPLDILYEDDVLVAVNKQPGMVVHPAKGNWSGTLTAALTFHFSNLSSVGGELRPGIVHRLDRDSSGVILVAKTDHAHLKLAKQFEKRSVQKTYFAMVSPAPDRDRDWIRQPIGVHPYQREKMAVREGHRTSRPAETFFEVEKRFRGMAIVRAFPKTGRTHQIRLHLAHVGCPVLCDSLYSGRTRITFGMVNRALSKDAAEFDEVLLGRQALHAHRIEFRHPESNQTMSIEAPIPDDLSRVVEYLEQCRRLA